MDNQQRLQQQHRNLLNVMMCLPDVIRGERIHIYILVESPYLPENTLICYAPTQNVLVLKIKILKEVLSLSTTALITFKS